MELACKLVDYSFRGARGGHAHLSNAGRMQVGNRRPKAGYTDMFTVMGDELDFKFLGIDSWIKGGAGPHEWVRAHDTRHACMVMLCPTSVTELIKLPMVGRSLIRQVAKLKWRRRMPPPDPMTWALKYGLTIDCMFVGFVHRPRPPDQGQRSVGITHIIYATTI